MSKKNFDKDIYPEIDQMKFPNITYKDTKLNKAIMLHSMNVFMTMQEYYEGKEKKKKTTLNKFLGFFKSAKA